MKRIYYGNVTIDTSNDIADLAQAISVEAARSFHNAGHQAPGGFTTQSIPVGRTELVTVNGFVEGAASATTIDLQVGSGIAFAVAAIEDTRPEPTADGVLSRLTEQLASLRGDEES